MTEQRKPKEEKETPLMKQYNQIKAKHPQALLLFRVGDFYETFGEDAIETARILGIVLTSRKNGSSDLELAGFPHHSLENYLPKLVRAGKRVAICDQLEDPKMTKTIVKRGVTELVTPGISFNDNVLEQKTNNFLCALHIDKTQHGVAFLDASTGEFLVAQGTKSYVEKLIQGFLPTEIVFQKRKNKEFEQFEISTKHCFRLEDWVFVDDFANESLQKHFQTNSLKGFGLEHQKLGVVAAGAILHYLAETEHHQLAHITSISKIQEDQYVWLDRFTVRNLELLHSVHENAVSLINIVDKTVTPMGGRMMKRWVVLPLKIREEIENRLAVVRYFVSNIAELEEIGEGLKKVNDLERLITKIAVGRVNPREIRQLLRTLLQIEPIQQKIKDSSEKSLKSLGTQIDVCSELIQMIVQKLHPDPAIALGKGPVIAQGIHAELDELRDIANSGKQYLEDLQKREIESTGITSLKVAFNNVFGYYIEVRNTHKDKVPETWTRKQTLVAAERYITEELKEYESKILGAEEKIYAIEFALYQELVQGMIPFISRIQNTSNAVAKIDCLTSFANVALQNNYAAPTLNDGLAIDIRQGRHPVIEKQLKPGETYVANDVFLDDDKQQIIMITGPNMSGKSAILRQTALICLMAQMGSFVPAQSAELGILDKVFTRVGASDNISSGESTFMVEMNETANILNNISDRSLVLMDEIGRGTSTYDGISIAWAIAEYLHEFPKAKAKTLFATHYHELNEMTEKFERIKNFNVQVKEVGQKILFVRKLIEGGSEHSFGIHVAQLAGMPGEVLHRSKQILAKLEESHDLNGQKPSKSQIKDSLKSSEMQLSFFQLNDPVLEQIREELVNIDINVLTPVEALMKLNDIKKWIGG